jgi:hypothetical protein
VSFRGLIFAVEVLDRIRGELSAMLGREGHAGQHTLASASSGKAGLGSFSQLICDFAPLSACGCGFVKVGRDEGSDAAASADVAHLLSDRTLRSGETSFEYERDVQPRPKLGRWTTELDEWKASASRGAYDIFQL